MTPFPRLLALLPAAALAIALAGCATPPVDPGRSGAGPTSSELAARTLALDPERVSDTDVREVLAKGPTPRIVLIHGGIYPVHLVMQSFGEFLVGMGYPESAIRDPGDASYSWSPYDDHAAQAGAIAWYYEREGVRPLLVGHSQGGIQVVKVLHTLAGSFGDAVRIYNPVTASYEDRTTILDPLTGRTRPVVGTSVAFAAVVGTGGWSLALPNHWIVLANVREIPDTVDEFTGYRIGFDFFAWDIPGLEDLKTFRAANKAVVRNVTLPAEYSHVFVPDTARLLENPARRAWINGYVPGNGTPPAAPRELDGDNIVFAADAWHSIKRHWVIEAQRVLRSGSAKSGAPR
jgi:hypothetical protein